MWCHRGRDDWRPVAQRPFAITVWYRVARLVLPWSGILNKFSLSSRRLPSVCQRRVEWHPYAPLPWIWHTVSSRRLTSVFNRVVRRRQASFNLRFLFYHVATLGVILLQSWIMDCRGVCCFDLDVSLGFATTGVGLPASCLIASLRSSALNMGSCVCVLPIGEPQRRSPRTVSCGIWRLLLPLSGVLRRPNNGRRRDARHWFTSFVLLVSVGLSTLCT